MSIRIGDQFDSRCALIGGEVGEVCVEVAFVESEDSHRVIIEFHVRIGKDPLCGFERQLLDIGDRGLEVRGGDHGINGIPSSLFFVSDSTFLFHAVVL